MQLADDSELAAVLNTFGVGPDALLGAGGEAWVFALDPHRILRVEKPGANGDAASLRRALLGELSASADRVPFAIPQVLDVADVEGRIATVETRLPGRNLSDAIDDARGARRTDLVRAYLEAASRIGDLLIERPYYGEVARIGGLQCDSSHAYLEAAAARSLAIAGPDFRHLDARELAHALPEALAPALVHLDAFPGNMLSEGGAITAVLDFSVLCLIGDRRLDPLVSAAYLAPEVTPIATDDDRSTAREWLDERGLAVYYAAAERWLAAFWSAAVDEARLQGWSRRLLGIPSRS